MDFFSIDKYIDKHLVTVQLWDTAGQERYRSVISSYYQQAHGIILVYDVTSRASFNNCIEWLNIIRNKCSPDSEVLLVGNKKDLDDQRNVPDIEGEEFSREEGLYFMETSALDNKDKNINTAFDFIIEKIAKVQIPLALETWSKIEVPLIKVHLIGAVNTV